MHELAISNTRAELSALIGRAGDLASWRFVEFFTVNIRNRNTCAAYRRAATVFLNWCDARDLRLAGVQPVHVTAYIEGLLRKAPGSDDQATSGLHSCAL
jgi:integrase/recombinase XerD